MEKRARNGGGAQKTHRIRARTLWIAPQAKNVLLGSCAIFLQQKFHLSKTIFSKLYEPFALYCVSIRFFFDFLLK